MSAGQTSDMPLFTKYLQVCFAYGALHSAIHLRKKEGVYYDKSDYSRRVRQLLIGDKIIYGMAISLAAPCYWPCYIHYDLVQAELALRPQTHRVSTFHPLLDLI